MSRARLLKKIQETTYDIIIVGSGFAGANMAYLFGKNKKKVLIIEAGSGVGRSRSDYMENFYLNTFKSPSSPYPPNDNALEPEHTNAPRATIQALVEGWNDPSKSYLVYNEGSMPFSSTYERVAGGTGNHWMGTCLRMDTHDFILKSTYGHGLDWPIGYNDLISEYETAESLIGVSGDRHEQEQYNGPKFSADYQYPMKPIPNSYLDRYIAGKINGQVLTKDNPSHTKITSTPAGRNSQPYQNRRVCHGNTNCTPICPIQAKYDPQFTLSLAMDTGYVDIVDKTVVSSIEADKSTGYITKVNYITYEDISVPASEGSTGSGTLSAPTIILAAHAIENAKILLHSEMITGQKIANSSGLVGKNLMDHVVYLSWGVAKNFIYGYRGPLSTGGIENLRDGAFRNDRASWRVEIGNEGWNWPANDPYTTTLDHIYGTNMGQLNPGNVVYAGQPMLYNLSQLFPKQFRFGFLIEQDAQESNQVTLSPTYKDNLGLPRPLLSYQLSEYTKKGFVSAKEASGNIMKLMGAREYTQVDSTVGTYFEYGGQGFNYSGAGHICGTHIMGKSKTTSVVDSNQKSWDHPNLYIVGCGSMPSIGSQNPTLTMLALACRTVKHIMGQIA